MAVIVIHGTEDEELILLGAGYGAWATARGSAVLGDWMPATERGADEMALVCDGSGALRWVYTDALTVVSVDGATPAEVLGRRGEAGGA